MKILHFGYDRSSHPYGTFEQEGLGLKENGKLVGPTYGELIDVINLYNENYIIYKVINAFNNDERYIGKYEVRRAIADLYANGTGVLYIDKKKDYNSEKLETIINYDDFQNRLANGEDFIKILDVLPSDNYAFDGVLKMKDENECINVCTIDHDVFEYKNSLLKKCLSSMSDMQEKIDELRRKK